TRAEFIRVMMNVLLGDIDEFYKENEAGINEIAAAAELKDFDKVPNWAKSSMYTAIAFGYISGDDNGNVNSDGLITRNEAATIIARLLQNVGM
ncbi:MAG: S-layer homology domain-containing protein, partial [Clostridia bacterium]|nr:S-layer homology domain-containing protein [Clostridia bacterium]